MSKLGDRMVMTLIAGTAVLGLLGYVLTVLVYEPPQWLPWFMIPAVFAVLVVAVFVVIWEGLDLMD